MKKGSVKVLDWSWPSNVLIAVWLSAHLGSECFQVLGNCCDMVKDPGNGDGAERVCFYQEVARDRKVRELAAYRRYYWSASMVVLVVRREDIGIARTKKANP